MTKDPSCTVGSDPSENITLFDCLDKFTSGRELGVDDAWFCPDCKGFVQATRKCDIWKLPSVLVIYLTRFTHNR